MKSNKSFFLQFALGVAVSITFITLLGAIKYFQIRAAIAEGEKQKPPPDTVSTTTTALESWPTTVTSVGTLTAIEGATLAVQEPGTVAKINFESGSRVAPGAVLIELDTSVEDANLRAAQARAVLARQTLSRAENLRATNALSTAELEHAQSQFNAASADVEALRATIARKRVVAPYSGRTGVRQVSVGQFITAGQAVVSLFGDSGLYLDFSVPERGLGEIKVGLPISFRVDALPGERFGATIQSVDPMVDVATRAVKVRGKVTGPINQLLQPGMFAHVEIDLPNPPSLIALPGSSITYTQNGPAVFVVRKMQDPQTNAEYTGVQQLFVNLGTRRGDRVAILRGLTVGQEVVTAGVFKLRPGAPISVNNSIVPKNELNPTPADT
jgi:membrane fusion protein (multidrug efflux system)